MAKIIYGVAGEGFGHSSRSQLIGQRLIDAGHDVMFVGSRKSLLYLKQYFGERVKEIFGLSFAYGQGRINRTATLRRNLLSLPRGAIKNERVFRQYFEPFGPDLVISDFEPFSAWWAWRNDVPFIGIDNEHVLTLCELEHLRKNWFSRLTSNVVTKCHYMGAVAYVIINFFRARLRIDSAILAPPIIRPEVTRLEPVEGEHILVYTTTGKGRKQMCDMLSKFGKRQFYIYGFDENARAGSCIFKKRSTEGFLADLAGARAVVASAGFSLISECMYLKKKMLLLPVAGQYEQIINAHYVQKLGLGVSASKLDEEALRRLFAELDKPTSADERIIWPDNDKFFQILQNVLHKLDKPISISLC